MSANLLIIPDSRPDWMSLQLEHCSLPPLQDQRHQKLRTKEKVKFSTGIEPTPLRSQSDALTIGLLEDSGRGGSITK